MERDVTRDHIDSLVGKVVDEYFQQISQGRQPQLDEFVEQYPEIANLLKSIIPALQAAEETAEVRPVASEKSVSGNSNEQPKQLGDFRILQQIGRGGMGVVYEAEQLSMSRHVALKILPLAGLIDEPKIQRFKNEVRAVAALNHPNIVSVYLVGQERGVHYYAMELIRGRSLAEVVSSLKKDCDSGEELNSESISRVARVALSNDEKLQRSGEMTATIDSAECRAQLKIEELASDTVVNAHATTVSYGRRRDYYRSVVELAIQAAEALQHAHEQGVIHRDIKPANLLIDGACRLYVTDFGLARIESDVGMTMTGDLIGTLRYMSPEQALAKRVVVDHRADIYSLAATFYEILTLRPVYLSDDRQQLLKQIAFEEPITMRRVDPDIPVELETIIQKGMAKDMDMRYATAQELADDLRAHLESRPIKAKPPTLLERAGKWTQRNLVLTWAAIVTLALVSITLAGSTFFMMRQLELREQADAARQVSQQREADAQESLFKIRWAHEHTIPEIQRLVAEEQYSAALFLAGEVEGQLPEDDLSMERLWPEFAIEASIQSAPSGVQVAIRDLDSEKSDWKVLGTTPIDDIRLAKGKFHWRLTASGYEPLVLLRGAGAKMRFELRKSGDGPPGMVRVQGGRTFISLSGVSDEIRRVGDFLIDRHEVTNQQYQQFVDHGGYKTKKYWKHFSETSDSTESGSMPSWEEAMTLFVDSTGQAGPAVWEAGHYPEGHGDFPVRGVSWFEADAFAQWLGKRLPSIYHWARAADLWSATQIIPYSNFDRLGPAPVGLYSGVGGRGVFDMAGNVKEWCRNGTGTNGTHYILGGAWNEPKYMFNDPDYHSPLARAETFGFRCIQIIDEDGTDAEVDDDVSVYRRDFAQVEPVSDAVFEAYKSEYAYDETAALNATVLSTKDHDFYTHEKIEFDAAYGDERVTAHLYLPTNVKPPFQTIAYFPPGHTMNDKQFDETKISWQVSFLVETGRAVIYPIYKGTFERKSRLQSSEVAQSLDYKKHVIMWSQDLSRTIDYLEQRQDIDNDKIGYYGYSWGGMMGAILPAVESRVKVQLLSGVGLSGQAPLPAVDQVNFISRVSLPTLMLSGEFNTFFPIEKSVQPFFDLLGTAPVDKRLLTYKSGQFIPDKELRNESAAWFDKYLGPVRSKPGMTR